MQSNLFQFIEWAKLISMPDKVWPSMNRYGMFYVPTSTLPPSMHRKQNNRLSTKYHVELEDSSILFQNSFDYSIYIYRTKEYVEYGRCCFAPHCFLQSLVLQCALGSFQCPQLLPTSYPPDQVTLTIFDVSVETYWESTPLDHCFLQSNC